MRVSGEGAAGAVVIVQGGREWPPGLVAAIEREGFCVVRIDDARLVPFFILAGGVAAVLVDAHGLEVLGSLALRKCRDFAPATTVVVMIADATPHSLKRALESGATTFLPWSAPAQSVAQVLRTGAAR